MSGAQPTRPPAEAPVGPIVVPNAAKPSPTHPNGFPLRAAFALHQWCRFARPSACHAEGQGFESLQPLPWKPLAERVPLLGTPPLEVVADGFLGRVRFQSAYGALTPDRAGLVGGQPSTRSSASRPPPPMSISSPASEPSTISATAGSTSARTGSLARIARKSSSSSCLRRSRPISSTPGVRLRARSQSSLGCRRARRGSRPRPAGRR